jgi:glyoxylase-like metal-dependent hydrolase (beta-lactamase superfamily II)
VPGHSPDALAVQVGEEVLLVGDTVLPEITPFPSREASFDQLRGVLEPSDTVAHSLFGLRAYLASLGKLMRIGKALPEALVLPAHRLYRNGEWSPLRLAERAEEIVAHHGNRCAEMLQIVKQGPKSAREIAEEYFPARLLQGMGMYMGENEVHSHCELLIAAGDAFRREDGTFSATGSLQVEPLIQSLSSG